MSVDREQRIRELMREHHGDESWNEDLCSDTPGDHKRFLLVEENEGRAADVQPVFLTTHDTPEEASAHWIGQEYREDWKPVRLEDLDTGEVLTAEVRVLFASEPDPLEQHQRMSYEHTAWLQVVEQLRARGVGDIDAGGKDERLHDAIVLWGEELAQLRLHDPDDTHAERALAERREKYGSA